MTSEPVIAIKKYRRGDAMHRLFWIGITPAQAGDAQCLSPRATSDTTGKDEAN